MSYWDFLNIWSYVIPTPFTHHEPLGIPSASQALNTLNAALGGAQRAARADSTSDLAKPSLHHYLYGIYGIYAMILNDLSMIFMMFFNGRFLMVAQW